MRNAATQEALRSNMRYRHGAVITKGGKILGQGHNHIRTGFSGPLSATTLSCFLASVQTHKRV